MAIPLLGIDAFTSEPFRGNPAAVCLLKEPADEIWMQALAAEMNLSETAFVAPQDDGYSLRWFTPTAEAKLCGHATLASAHALWETGGLPTDQVARFHTRWKGLLTATTVSTGIALDFPAAPSFPCKTPDRLSQALGVPIVATAVNDLHYIVELEDADAVRNATPDFGALSEIAVEVAITARSDDDDHDFVSRYFAPRYGIDEDPVTGSAHTSLGPYWAAKLGKAALRAYQVSRRGGELLVEVRGNRVDLIGQAVTVWRGELA